MCALPGEASINARLAQPVEWLRAANRNHPETANKWLERHLYPREPSEDG